MARSYPQSDYCYVCRKKQLLKAGPEARVQCAFCNGFAHASCLYTEGTERVAANRPALFRCNNCVMELPAAYRFASKVRPQLLGESETFQHWMDELTG